MISLIELGVGGAPSFGTAVSSVTGAGAEIGQRAAPGHGQAQAAVRAGVSRFLWITLVLFLIANPAHASQDRQSTKFEDWNSVQELPTGARTHVRQFKNRVQSGVSRKITGRLVSTTPESITLLTKAGETRTIQRDSIETVRFRRPFIKRPAGWVVGVSVAIIACAITACDPDITRSFVPLVVGAYAVPAALAGFFLMPPKLVYLAPMAP